MPLGAISGALGIGSAIGGLLGGSTPDIPRFTAERVPTSEEIEDVLKAAGLVGDFNTGQGAEQAIDLGQQFNAENFAQIMESLGTQFGGLDVRDSANQVIRNQLDGQLSPATQRLLSMRSAQSGATELGSAAVRDLNTLQLGIQTEQQVQQGLGNFQSQFQLFRGAFEPARAEQLLNFTGITPQAGINAALQGASLQLQRDQFAHQAAVARATGQAAQNGAFWQGLGGVAGIGNVFSNGGGFSGGGFQAVGNLFGGSTIKSLLGS